MCIIELYILARDFMIIDEKNGWINDYEDILLIRAIIVWQLNGVHTMCP